MAAIRRARGAVSRHLSRQAVGGHGNNHHAVEGNVAAQKGASRLVQAIQRVGVPDFYCGVTQLNFLAFSKGLRVPVNEYQTNDGHASLSAIRCFCQSKTGYQRRAPDKLGRPHPRKRFPIALEMHRSYHQYTSAGTEALLAPQARRITRILMGIALLHLGQ